jgi:formylglycine-generating enzyme required for sulfatase activity
MPDAEMKFAYIPPGSFYMGGTADDEKPIREVTLAKGYYMGITLVTQAQWLWVMGNDSRPSHFTGDDRPVENVSWIDCQGFLAEFRKRINRPVRLPTEAEWEYACRAGSTTDYFNGNDEKALARAGWYAGNSDKQTHPVAQKQANRWGLYDMHGNVWEWCSDWGDAAYYKKGENKDPQGPQSGTVRVLRGGSWGDVPERCRAAYRNWDDPSFRNDFYGFRVCFAWTS